MRSLVEALLADRQVRLVDDEGRPLTEQADVDPAEHVSEVTCRYEGRRHGMPMNGAALAQVNRHWSGICQDLRARVPRQATVQQAFQVSLEVVSAALLWTDGRLPGAVAARYKACVGFCQVFAWLLLEEESLGHSPLSGMGSGGEFLDWVEQQGWLAGTRQVCAGSARQIKSVFEIFCSGDGPPPGPSEPLEVVALQAALAMSTYLALAAGQPADASLGCRLLEQGRAPWLFAVTARPGASPELARRFFSNRGRVGSLERFLAGDPVRLCHPEREALFWDCLPTRR